MLSDNQAGRKFTVCLFYKLPVVMLDIYYITLSAGIFQRSFSTIIDKIPQPGYNIGILNRGFLS